MNIQSFFRGIFCLFIGVLLAASGSSQTVDMIVNIAGIPSYTGTYSGDGGPATAAVITPNDMCIDGAGNIYIVQRSQHRVRKISTDGTITRFAGTGTAGYNGDGIPATDAQLSYPRGIAADADGNIYITDASNGLVRKVNTLGIISTVAGDIAGGVASGDGGPATDAVFGEARSICVDGAGNIYFYCHNLSQIKKVATDGTITRFAGRAALIYGYCGDGGPASNACLNSPTALCSDAAGNIFIADGTNNRIRMVNTSGIITTIAGTGSSAGFNGDDIPATDARISNVGGLVADAAGDIYLSLGVHRRVRKIDMTTGLITTVIGNGSSGFDTEPVLATAAELYSPDAVALDPDGDLHVAESGTHRIMKMVPCTVPTVTVTGADTICSGTSTVFVASGADSYSWEPTLYLSTYTGSTVTFNYTGLSTRTYTITGTNEPGCTSTAIHTVESVLGPPYVNFNPSTTGVCLGSSVTFNAYSPDASLTYSWAPSGELSASTGTPVTCTPTATQTYTLTWTHAGCSGEVTRTITVSPVPAISVTADQDTLCSGGNTDMTVSGTGFSFFLWTPSDELSAASGTTVNATPTATTVYTVTGYGGPCPVSAYQQVTVRPEPTLTVIPTASTICFGSDADISVSGADTYIWEPATGLSATTGSTVNCSATSSTSYTVTGTDVHGCVGAGTQDITVGSVLSMTVTPVEDTLCVGNTTTMTASGGTGYTWAPATGLSATTGATVTCSVGTTTTYTLTGTTAGCVGEGFQTIFINSVVPTVTVIPTSATLCAGDNTDIAASGASTYVWTPASGLSETTGQIVNSSPTTTTTYTVTGTYRGCTNSAEQTITVNPLPVVTATAVDPTICTGNTTDINAAGADSYSWAPATGLSATTGASVTCSATATTTYTVTGATDGCNNVTTVTVSVNTTPTVTATPTSATICSGNTTTITATGADSYTWTPGTGLSATTGATVSSSALTTTTYTVTGTTLGCSASATQTISVNATPTVTATPTDGTICTGNNTDITALGATDYIWSPATGLSATTGSVVNADPLGTTTYTITGTSSGCAATTTQVISVNVTPTVTATVDNPTICSGENTNVNAFGADSYLWTPSAGLSATTGGIVSCTATGTTIYTVTGTSDGCSSTVAQMVSVNPVPAITIVPVSATICSEDNTDITASGADSYSWSPAAGLSVTTGSIVNTTVDNTTTYSVTGTTDGCSGIATQVIDVNPNPSISVSATSALICSGNSTDITATGADSYVWAPATDLSATTGSTVSFSGTTTTTYTVTGTTSGCDAITTITITVNPTPVVTITPVSSTMCSDDNTDISVSGADTYIWLPGTGLDNTTGSTVNCTVNSTTTYTVTGTAGSCSASATQVIAVNPTPTLTATSDASEICNGDNAYITLSGAATYEWSPAVGLSATTGSSAICSASVTTTYSITGSASGCSSSETITITVKPNPVVVVVPVSATICIGDNTNITASGADTYSWTPGTGLSSTTGATVTSSTTESTLYSVTGTTNGCSTTTDQLIVVTPVPTVTVTAAITAICAEGNTDITASGALSYSWSPSTGLNTTTGGIVNCTVNSNTTYTVTGTTDGCSAVAEQEITILPSPSITVNADASAFCSGENTNITASGADTYTWSPAIGLSATSGDAVVCSAGTTTTYTVTGTALGCTDSKTQTITVSVTPTLTVTSDKDTICRGGNTYMTVTGGAGFSSYAWNPSSELSSGTWHIVGCSPTVTSTYTVSSTVGVCTGTTTKTIYVANPVASFMSFPAEICLDDTVTIIADGGDSYVWDTPPGSYRSEDTLHVIGYSTGVRRIVATAIQEISTGNCYSEPDTVYVDVLPLPTISVTPSAHAFCRGGATSMTVTGAVDYFWAPAIGLSATTGAAVGCDPDISKTYTITGTDAFGCTNSAIQKIIVAPNPILSIVASKDTMCQGERSNFNAEFTGVIGVDQYLWIGSTSGLSWSLPQYARCTSNVSRTYTLVGTTIHTFVGLPSVSCRDTAYQSIYVKPLPVVTISPSSSYSVCPGDSATLTASGATTYVWSSASHLSASTGASVKVSPPSTGFLRTYSVTGTMDGCSAVSQNPVMIWGHQKPNPFIIPRSGSRLSYCLGDTTQLVGAGGYAGQIYTWSPSTGLSATTSNGTSPAIYCYATETTTYTITSTHPDNGCIGSGSGTIEVWSLPTTSVSSDTTKLCKGQTTNITATGAETYSWLPAGGLSATTGGVVNCAANASTTYTVTGHTINGCTTTDTIAISADFLKMPGIVANTGCAGPNSGSIDLALSGGTLPYTILWDDNTNAELRQGLSKGDYSVVVTDGFNCQISKEFTIDSFAEMSAHFLCATRVVYPSSNVHFVNLSFPTPSSSIWTFGDPNNSTSTKEDPDFYFPSGSGDSSQYTVTLIAAKGACRDTVEKTIWVIHQRPGGAVAANATVDNFLQMNAFPNPTNGVLSVDIKTFEVAAAKLELYDMVGKLRYEVGLKEASESHADLDLSKLPKGYYLLKGIAKGYSETLKIVVY